MLLRSRLIPLLTVTLFAPAVFAAPGDGHGHRRYGQQVDAHSHHAASHGYGKHGYTKHGYAKHGYAQRVVVHQQPTVVVQQAPAYAPTYAPAYAPTYAPATAPWSKHVVARVSHRMRRQFGVSARLGVLQQAMSRHHGWLDGNDLVTLADAIGPRHAVRDLVAVVRPILLPLHGYQVSALLARTIPPHRDAVLAMLGGATACGMGHAHGQVAVNW